MAEWMIYFNTSCDNCRATLAILKENNAKPDVIEYLKNPPSISTLDAILKKARLRVDEIVRKDDPLFKELKLDQGDRPRKEWLRLLSERPILLQHPLVVRDQRAVLAQPPEKVKELL